MGDYSHLLAPPKLQPTPCPLHSQGSSLAHSLASLSFAQSLAPEGLPKSEPLSSSTHTHTHTVTVLPDLVLYPPSHPQPGHTPGHSWGTSVSCTGPAQGLAEAASGGAKLSRAWPSFRPWSHCHRTGISGQGGGRVCCFQRLQTMCA